MTFAFCLLFSGPRRHANESGYALISVLLTTAVLLPLGAFAVMQARLDALVAQRTRLAAATFAVAESGLEHALADLAADPRFTRLTLGPDGRPGGGDDGEYPFRTPPGAFPAAPYHYEVGVVSGGADRAEIVARGYGPFGAVRGVAASVRRGALPWLPGTLASEAPRLALRLGDGWRVAGAAGDATHDDVAALALRDAAALPSDAAARLSGPGGPPSLRRDAPPIVAALLAAARQRTNAVSLGAAASGALGDGIFLCRGSLRLSQVSGSGILLVDGPLEIDGALNFAGLIVVDGDVRVSDAASVTIDGGLLQGPAGTVLRLEGAGALRYDAKVLARLAATWPDLLALPARVTGWRELAEAAP